MIMKKSGNFIFSNFDFCIINPTFYHQCFRWWYSYFAKNEEILQEIKVVMKMDKKKLGWCIVLLGVIVAVAIILIK